MCNRRNMAKRRVAYLCVRCHERGHMAPVFSRWSDLQRHHTQKHASRGGHGAPTLDVVARRVLL